MMSPRRQIRFLDLQCSHAAIVTVGRNTVAAVAAARATVAVEMRCGAVSVGINRDGLRDGLRSGRHQIARGFGEIVLRNQAQHAGVAFIGIDFAQSRAIQNGQHTARRHPQIFGDQTDRIGRARGDNRTGELPGTSKRHRKNRDRRSDCALNRRAKGGRGSRELQRQFSPRGENLIRHKHCDLRTRDSPV